MKPSTHNGFILAYTGPIFPPANSNRISKECYYFMGGLANERLYRVRKHGRDTYYNISVM